MRLKYRPEDFSVKESWRYDEVPGGGYFVYALDKQKLSTFDAVDRISVFARLPRSAISFCGLKDKQGRTEQLIAIKGQPISLQEEDLRLRPVGETDAPLSARNTTSNRFAVTVRDLGEEDVERLPESVSEVNRLGVTNYFDSQRFGHLKHGQGFIAKDLLKGNWEHALHNLIAQPSTLDRSGDHALKTFWQEHWGDWRMKGPAPDRRTQAILRKLRERAGNYKEAFLTLEPRYRALILFTYQSFLWNEGVKLALLELLPRKSLCEISYQAGALLFPREAPREILDFLRNGTFPLLAPESAERLPEGEGMAATVRRAVEASLRREKLTLPALRIPESPLFFRHEERPLTVIPGKLVVSRAERDEFFRGRLRVRLAFTLASGSYATLVVRRLFWFSESRERITAEPEAPASRAPPRPPPAPSAAPAAARPDPRASGFLAKKRARQAVRSARQAASREAAKTPGAPKAKAHGKTGANDKQRKKRRA